LIQPVARSTPKWLVFPEADYARPLPRSPV